MTNELDKWDSCQNTNYITKFHSVKVNSIQITLLNFTLWK